MTIVPGILTDDIEKLNRQVKMAVGLASWVQIDFLDGEYADNQTVRPREIDLRKLKKIGLVDGDSKLETRNLKLETMKFEAHLMVAKQNFRKWAEEAIQAGFDRIMPQIESLDMSQKEFVKWIKSEDIQAALSLDAQTPVSAIEEEVLVELDVVQVMTIKAGWSGQQMLPELLDKVKKLHELRIKNDELRYLTEVDGGVKLENVRLLKEMGVDLAEVNSGLFCKAEFLKRGICEEVNKQEEFEKNLRRFNQRIG